MPSYFYKAKKDSTHTVSGQISAQNQDEAVELISQLGLVPVVVEEKTNQGMLVSNIKPVAIKNRDVTLFTKQLASLMKSSVPLLKALESISVQTRSLYFSKVIEDIAMGVKSGRSFSSCLGDYPQIFSSLYVAMVRAGEEMGQMRQMLLSISEYLRKHDDFSSKVKSAMVYPAIMLSVGIATVFFILTFVMPKMAVIYTDSGQHLPLPTTIVMGVSRFLKNYWMVIGIVVAGGSLVFLRWKKTVAGSILMGGMCLRIPGLRDFVIKADLARFCRTMNLLLESGLPLIRALESAIGTIHNPQLRADILVTVEGLTGGEGFAACLRQSSLIPTMAVQIISVGEESGSLNESLLDIAESYEAEINESTRVITTILEPLMILGIGLVIGFIVFAMLMPIFSMDLLAR